MSCFESFWWFLNVCWYIRIFRRFLAMLFLWRQRCSLGRDRSELSSLSLALTFSASEVSLRIFVHFCALFSTFRCHVNSVRASCLSLPLPPSLSFLPALPSLTPPLPHLTLPYSPLFTAALCVVYATFYCSFHVGRSLFMTNPVPISFISVPILSEFYKSGAFSILPYV